MSNSELNQAVSSPQEMSPSVKEQLLTQINYYFSRKNISNDVYLVSHMNSELFVPISVVAAFAKIKALTDDIHVLLDAMKSSDQVVVDEVHMRVRPTFRLQRNTLILRDIPSDAEIGAVQELLKGDGIPPIQSIRPDIGNNWFITMETEDAAKLMFDYIRTLMWEGNPIPVRIKSENLLKSVHEREPQLEPNQEAVKADVKLPPGYIPPQNPASTDASPNTSTSAVFSAPPGATSAPNPNFYFAQPAIGPNGEVFFHPGPFALPPPDYGMPTPGQQRFFQPAYPHMVPPYSHGNGQWRPNQRRPYLQHNMSNPYQSGGGNGGGQPRPYNNNYRPRYNYHNRSDSDPSKEFVNSEEIPRSENYDRRPNQSSECNPNPSQQRPSQSHYSNNNSQGMQRPNRSSNYSQNQSQQSSSGGRNNLRGQRQNNNNLMPRRSSQSNIPPYNPDNFPALSPSPIPSLPFTATKAYNIVAAESGSREMSPLMSSNSNGISYSSNNTQSKRPTVQQKKFTPSNSPSPPSRKPIRNNMMQDELSLVNDLLPSVESLNISQHQSSDPSASSSPTGKSFSYAEALRKTTPKKEDSPTNTTTSLPPNSSSILPPSKEIKA